jgi:TPR repeat protein
MKKLVFLLISIIAYGGEYERGDDEYKKGKYLEAYNIWIEACNKGEGESCNAIGLLYDEGEGVLKNGAKAFDYYKKACDLGDQWGCNNYGYSLIEIDKVKNAAKGIELITLACDKQIGLACHNLGYYHYKGEIVAKDIKKAVYLYDKACIMGDKEACKQLPQLKKRLN